MKQRTFPWMSSLLIHGALFCSLALAKVEESRISFSDAPVFRCAFAAERLPIREIARSSDLHQWPMRRCDHVALIRREIVRHGDTPLGDFVCEVCGRIFGRVTGKPLGWRAIDVDLFDE